MYVYIDKILALNDQQSLMCHKIQPTNQPTLSLSLSLSLLFSVSLIQEFFLAKLKQSF